MVKLLTLEAEIKQLTHKAIQLAISVTSAHIL